MLSPFPSLLSSLLTRPKLESNVKGSTLQVTGYWHYVWVQGQGERGHRPVQSFLPGNWKEVWSSIPHYPCFLKKDLISIQIPTSKKTGCFFWKLLVQDNDQYWGCTSACIAILPACQESCWWGKMGYITGGEAFRASFLWETSGWLQACCAAPGDFQGCVGSSLFLSIQFILVGFPLFWRWLTTWETPSMPT